MSLFSEIVAGGIDPEQHDSVLLRRIHTLRLSTIAMVVFAAMLGRIRTDSLEQLGWWLFGSQVLILLRLGLGFARIAAYTAVAEDLRGESEARLSPATARMG